MRNPEELEIVAVIDTNEFRALEGAKRYGIARENCFTSLEDFISAKVECDFIVNGTTDRYHYETAMKVIGAGYNMILEKPITSSKQELMNIVNLAKEKREMKMAVVEKINRFSKFSDKVSKSKVDDLCEHFHRKLFVGILFNIKNLFKKT